MYSVEPSPYGGGFLFGFFIYILIMKELIVITAHCTDEEQVLELENCVNSVSDFGYHIALISHTHIPLHIQKKCQYYFYDYLNDISEDTELLGFKFFRFDNGDRIESKLFNKYFYGFAIYRMFSISFKIAKTFGYDIIHHLEYDCQILDKKLLDKHSELLLSYDSVFYTDGGKPNGFMFGSFKSFKVDKLPKLLLDYNRGDIEHGMKNLQNTHLENLTRNSLINQENYCILPIEEINQYNFSRGKNFQSRNIHYTLYYDNLNKTLNLFYNSLYDDKKISVTINQKEVYFFEIKKGFWRKQNLGNFDRVEHVKIDNGERILYNKSFDLTFKEQFKKISFIYYEKNN
jgi:hypothetical protein